MCISNHGRTVGLLKRSNEKNIDWKEEAKKQTRRNIKKKQLEGGLRR